MSITDDDDDAEQAAQLPAEQHAGHLSDVDPSS